MEKKLRVGFAFQFAIRVFLTQLENSDLDPWPFLLFSCHPCMQTCHLNEYTCNYVCDNVLLLVQGCTTFAITGRITVAYMEYGRQ